MGQSNSITPQPLDFGDKTKAKGLQILKARIQPMHKIIHTIKRDNSRHGAAITGLS